MYLQDLSGTHKVGLLLKITFLGTAHLLRKSTEFPRALVELDLLQFITFLITSGIVTVLIANNNYNTNNNNGSSCNQSIKISEIFLLKNLLYGTLLRYTSLLTDGQIFSWTIMDLTRTLSSHPNNVFSFPHTIIFCIGVGTGAYRR